MTCQRRSLLTSLLWFFVAQASTNVDQIIGTKGETFLRKLKYNAEKHEKCREREKTPNHAFFRIAGNYMTFKDFYNLYQSLFTSSNPEEMVSVITIRNIHKKSFEANDYMKTIVKGLQHCVNNTGNSIVIDGLLLTLDYFNLEYPDEFNRQTQYIEQVSSIHKECEILFINNSYKICFDALKSQLLDQIEIKLSFCGIPRDSYYYYLLNATQQEDFKLKSWQNLESLIEKIKEGRYTAFFSDKNGNTETTFKKMYLELCSFEEKIQCNYFSGNYDQFRKFLLFLIQIEHMKSVNERATDLALQYVKIFELAEVKEMMVRFFTDIYIEFLQICMKAGIQFRSNEFYQTRNRFFDEEYFQEKLQNFFDNLPANDIKDRHCTKYRIANDMIRQEIEFEQVTKIFCNEEICSESLYQLCSILDERKIYNGFDYQFIYIDYGRIASDFDTNKCVSMCDNILFESSDKKKIVEFIAKIVPQSTDDGSTALQYFEYSSRATLTRDRSNLSCAKKTKEPNDTAITIDEYDKAGFVIASKEHVKTLTDKCLTTWKDCKILDRHVVHVAKNCESYIIHVIQLKQKNRVHDNLLLIYDIPIASKSTKQLDYQHDNRRFVCHNNVPIHFVNNLLQTLQFLQLTEHADFEIPNECSLSNIGPMLNRDFEGTEGILGYYDKADLKAFIYYHTKIGYCSYERLFIQDIDKHKTDRTQISEYLKRIIEKFGLEEAMFVRIISDFTMSVRSVDDALTVGNRRGKLSDNYKYKLIATIQNDESLNLRICRSVNNFYIDSVLLTTQKIFDTISKIKDVSPTFQYLDRIARIYNCKIPFFTLFYRNLFRQINYFTCAYYQYTSVLTGNECLRVIYESIESLFINICEMNNKSSIDIPETEVYHLSNVQKSINPQEIEKLAMQLANDINKSVKEKKMKVTSLKVKKAEDKCGYEIFERFAETLYYDPENTSLDDEH